MSIYDKIIDLCKGNGVPVTVLEKELGFSRGSIGKMKTAKRSPSIDRLQKIADYFNIPVESLQSFDSSTQKKNIIHVYHTPPQEVQKSIHDIFTGSDPLRISRRIPVLGRVAAGIPIDAIEDILDWEEISGEIALSGNYFGLKIKGDSMEPSICNDDVVIVRQQDDAEDGDIVIALVNGNDSVCKRLKKYKDGIALISKNPSYDPMYFTSAEIDETPVRIIGKVIELRRRSF